MFHDQRLTDTELNLPEEQNEEKPRIKTLNMAKTLAVDHRRQNFTATKKGKLNQKKKDIQLQFNLAKIRDRQR